MDKITEAMKKLTESQIRHLQVAGEKLDTKVTVGYVNQERVVNIGDQQFSSFARAARHLQHIAATLEDHSYLIG